MSKNTYESTRWMATGEYTQTREGLLYTTESTIGFDSANPDWMGGLWGSFASRESWLPIPGVLAEDKWERAYGRTATGGWKLQSYRVERVATTRCVRCHQAGCSGGYADAHE